MYAYIYVASIFYLTSTVIALICLLTFLGAREKDESQRSKSSVDVRDSDYTSDSPPISRRQKLWNSFKRKANKLHRRSRSDTAGRHHQVEEDRNANWDMQGDNQKYARNQNGETQIGQCDDGNDSGEDSRLLESSGKQSQSTDDMCYRLPQTHSQQISLENKEVEGCDIIGATEGSVSIQLTSE